VSEVKKESVEQQQAARAEWSESPVSRATRVKEVASGWTCETRCGLKDRGARILIADDEAVMREYVHQLLDPSYEVWTAGDCDAALAAIERDPPDLVISDAMMPSLDGIGLVQKLRADARTRAIPVILLARAGEEAKAKGLGVGADDVLVEPFGAPELLAIVRSQLRLARMRAEVARLATIESELREAVSARDDFVSIVAHELRSPLMPLQMLVRSLRRTVEKNPEKSLSKATRKKIVGIEEDVQHLITLVEKLLDVSRLSEKRLVLRPGEADLVEIVKEVRERLGSEIDTARCDVTVKGPASLVGYWDRVYLGQVVTNLLSNAVKYGAGKPVEIEVAASDGSARLSVTDHGVGVAPEHAERIFTRFQRGVSTTSHDGFGLGLWISKQLIGAMGGAIRLDSKAGRGATFTVTIPMRTADPWESMLETS
jgi:signal transduction histidine kinase